MSTLLDDLRTQLMDEEEYEKTSFWASECEKDKFDIYHRWLGTPPTNPIDAEKRIIFSAGKMMELAIIEKLRKLNRVIMPAKDGDEQEYFRIERHGVPISGRLDAIITDNGNEVTLEIKTIYGDYQIMDLENGNPRVSYLKQLAIYMDAKEMNKGYLLYFDRGTGQMFQFVLLRMEKLTFQCVAYSKNDTDGKHPNVITFNLDDDYKRFAMIYNEYIKPGIEPESDYIYKLPLESIDWASLPSSKISKARTGQAVIGSGWQIAYSPYKNLIVEKEAAKYGKTLDEYLGYTDIEMAKICELTKGYTTRGKK